MAKRGGEWRKKSATALKNKFLRNVFMFQKSFALFFHESEEKQFSQFVMENIECKKEHMSCSLQRSSAENVLSRRLKPRSERMLCLLFAIAFTFFLLFKGCSGVVWSVNEFKCQTICQWAFLFARACLNNPTHSKRLLSLRMNFYWNLINSSSNAFGALQYLA